MKESPPIFKNKFFIGCIVIFLCAALLGIFAFLLSGGKGEPANLITATKVSQKFLENINVGDIESAHSMLSEKFSPPITMEQFTMLIQQDAKIFQTFQKVEICDWGLFYSDGVVIDSTALLYYESGKIVVQISLHKDSDSVWRIQGFNFRSDINPIPFGLCH